jgi:hypothetical protein
VFSGTIVNWIKGGVKALQIFGSALKGLKAIKALMNGARGVMNAFEKMGRLFKALGSKIGGALGKAFDDVMEFFKGIFKWGDEVPAGAVDDVHAPGNKPDVDGSGGPKNDGPDGKKNKYNEGDGKDVQRNMAWAAAFEEVNSSNAENENLADFHRDLNKIKHRFPVVKYFLPVPQADGELIFMVASAPKPVGKKKLPMGVPKTPKFDWEHIFDRHSDWGKKALQSGEKTIFKGLTETQIKEVVQGAYKNIFKHYRSATQEGIVIMRGTYKSWIVEFWVNTATKTVETAYPILKAIK